MDERAAIQRIRHHLEALGYDLSEFPDEAIERSIADLASLAAHTGRDLGSFVSAVESMMIPGIDAEAAEAAFRRLGSAVTQ